MSNLVTDFTAQYVAALMSINGGYSANGVEYHNALDAYSDLMHAIETSSLDDIKKKKKIFEEQCKNIQKNLKEAWGKVSNEEFPVQESIHGINFVILKIIELQKNK